MPYHVNQLKIISQTNKSTLIIFFNYILKSSFFSQKLKTNFNNIFSLIQPTDFKHILIQNLLHIICLLILNLSLMDIFAQITKKCQQPQAAELIQILNKYRISLSQDFISQSEISRQKLIETLLNLQMDITDFEYQFDLNKIKNQNVLNLIKLQQTPTSQVKQNKKFNVDWTAVVDKRNNKVQIPKKNSPFQEVNANKIQNFQLKKGFFFQTQKEQKPKSYQFQNMKEKSETQKNTNQQKPAVVDFVSASNLPKSVSVRKKFVPPFKKQQAETIKQENNQDGEDQKIQDPRYKGLEKKLVDTIELEILQTKKSVKWEQIAGLEFAKKLINEMIVWPMLRPDIFTGMRAPPRGILLFGPPGTGKTMIGRAIASSANATFFNISASSLTSKWVGESQKLVRTLFQIARIKQPSVIFIDEIDSLLCARSEGEQESSRRVKTEFLVQLDGTKTGEHERILIIGATNLPQELDDAVRRRFIKRLYIPLPNHQSRAQLMGTLTESDTFSVKKQDIDELASLTLGFSGADIHSLCKEASMIPLRQISGIETIRFSEVPRAKLKHFKEALKFVKPSVNKKVLAKYEDWNEQYGSYQFNADDLEN